ncbi:metallophosphoesterase family protein [Candidatus Woesearchaeota archaeon]|nr:metallophosphoesterase family protein [Candidatus Woesearchaeota archaeon]
MRILGAADFHGDKSLAEKLADKAEREKADLVILCGDLIEDDSADNIIKPFTDKQQKVLLISGNHESIAAADFLATLNDAKHLHGYSVRYEDVGIFGCGSANVGIHGLTEDEIFDTLKRGHDRIAYLKKKLMVTHVHPRYSKMAGLGRPEWGSIGVSKAIKELQPDILFCSHLHEAEGIEEKIGRTRVINVGKEGKIIDL